MITAEYTIGATRIRIADDCVGSQEEQEKILERMGLRRKGGRNEEEVREDLRGSLRSGIRA